MNSKEITYIEISSIVNLRNALKRVKNNVTPGIDGETKQNITEKRLEKLHLDLTSQKYKPTPAKRVAIKKPGGGVRYIAVASNIDKVVQAVILNLFEPIFEPLFLNESYGFRPNRGCHNAMKEIKYG